jgi:hypothetical protein
VDVFQTHERMYQFEHLPAYAAFLLNEHLEDYVRESIRLSHEVNLPLLQHLKAFKRSGTVPVSPKQAA